MRLRHLHDCLFANPGAAGSSYVPLTKWQRHGVRQLVSLTGLSGGPDERGWQRRMRAGLFNGPFINDIGAVNGAGGAALSPRDAVNHGLLRFLVGFRNAEPDPISHPDSGVERGAEPH